MRAAQLVAIRDLTSKFVDALTEEIHGVGQLEDQAGDLRVRLSEMVERLDQARARLDQTRDGLDDLAVRVESCRGLVERLIEHSSEPMPQEPPC